MNNVFKMTFIYTTKQRAISVFIFILMKFSFQVNKLYQRKSTFYIILTVLISI